MRRTILVGTPAGTLAVQPLAHIPFVALPIVATIGRGLRATDGIVPARPLGDTA